MLANLLAKEIIEEKKGNAIIKKLKKNFPKIKELSIESKLC